MVRVALKVLFENLDKFGETLPEAMQKEKNPEQNQEKFRIVMEVNYLRFLLDKTLKYKFYIG